MGLLFSRIHSRKKRWATILVIFWAVCWWACGPGYLQDKRLVEQGNATTGIVTHEWQESGSNLHFYFFVFEDQQGKRWEGRAGSIEDLYSPGGSVAVRYLPEDPRLNCAEVVRRDKMSTDFVQIVMFSVASLLGLFFVLWKVPH